LDETHAAEESWGAFWTTGRTLCRHEVRSKSVGRIPAMCEANAYLLKDGKEELILEAVDVLENEDNQVRMANIFGEQKIVRGKIRSMSLVNHKILLEES
jgi:predicted RNA-binding protein